MDRRFKDDRTLFQKDKLKFGMGLLKRFSSLALLLISSLCSEERDLFLDLALVDKVDREIADRLPFFYNASLVGGYFNMPSARMLPTGTLAIGGGRVPPYNIFGANFQVFSHLELSANYRVYTGITEGNFGKEGFGDDAERIGNVKAALMLPEDGFSMLPSLAVGIDDFIGTKRFNSYYVVATKEWTEYNVEATLGYGWKRLKGFFGGIAWTPFRFEGPVFLKDLSLIAEYDAIDYKKHRHEHPEGRDVKSRINIGLTYVGWNSFQLSLSSVRGKKIAAFAALRYPLGNTQGFFPKVDDPLLYNSPVDIEPLEGMRSEKEFIQQLAYGFSDQGLDLSTAYLTYNEKCEKVLWIKVVNNRYREEDKIRNRLQHLLASLIPIDIENVILIIEADALEEQSYYYRKKDLALFRQGEISDFEMETLSPMREAMSLPNIYESTLLFHRRKPIWTFTARPRLLSFFGSAKGKFKYDIGLIAVPEGYLFDKIYYRIQLGYRIKSSMSDVRDTDRLNPSQLINVRTDTIRYFQSDFITLEQAYLQKPWNLKKGWFCRLATGYFESAYGGVAAEVLYYPVNSSWAVGAQSATVLKRKYEGIKFTHKVRKLKGHKVTHVPFVGLQYFLDLYYIFKPLQLDFKINIGQFLAKDKGARLEVGRYFSNGLRFSLWCTVTNGHDKVNGKTYFDKGFSFNIPLDLFLKQSSRTYMGYAMSAWLRDVGAQAETGKPLYWTLREERY
jgi:hypothetical protein